MYAEEGRLSEPHVRSEPQQFKSVTSLPQNCQKGTRQLLVVTKPLFEHRARRRFEGGRGWTELAKETKVFLPCLAPILATAAARRLPRRINTTRRSHDHRESSHAEPRHSAIRSSKSICHSHHRPPRRPGLVDADVPARHSAGVAADFERSAGVWAKVVMTAGTFFFVEPNAGDQVEVFVRGHSVSRQLQQIGWNRLGDFFAGSKRRNRRSHATRAAIVARFDERQARHG